MAPPGLHSCPTRRSSDLEHVPHAAGLLGRGAQLLGRDRGDERALGAEVEAVAAVGADPVPSEQAERVGEVPPDRKSTRLNSSHVSISYAVFCLKKKRKR